MTLSVRAAGGPDAPLVSRHVELSRVECSSFRGDPPGAPGQGVRLLIAEVDGHAVASAAWDEHGKSAELRHIWVDPPARGVGIGTRLLRACVDAARASGCSLFTCEVQPGNRPMKNLLEQQGIVARSIRAGLHLD